MTLAASGFRAHALDGAMLYFHRASGTSVRVETEATRHLRRAAPRVVMFGITNACNLRCEFCSRDRARASTWTVDTAASILEGLAAAGTLEVAFGGGEPYAFRGLGELIARLRRTTELALHVTTNGTMLDPAIDFDQIRLSIYDDWQPAAQALVGRRWGANVLVDDAALGRLPYLLAELAGLGASDVSLLSYVGPDPARHLSFAGEAVLAAVMRASPIPCRVSVCWGDRISHRLFGGDCGAGLDFVTLTSDRRMQSCSFQDVSVPVVSADDVLAQWGKRAMTAPSPRAGCMRSSPGRDLAGVRIFQGFSGNNSGECVLVARFEAVDDAEALLAELIPGYMAGEPYSAPWKKLFERERIASPFIATNYAPDEMAAIGTSFVVRTDSAAGDDFPDLRALAWKRGAYVVPGGIHLHSLSTALFVLRTPDVDAVLARARAEKAIAVRHGDRVIGAFGNARRPDGNVFTLLEKKEALERIAGGAAFVMELHDGPITEPDLAQRLANAAKESPIMPRLAASFWNRDASDFAKDVGVEARRGLVLVENVIRHKRLAVLALRDGAIVRTLEGDEVVVHAVLWPPPRVATKGTKAEAPPGIDRARLTRLLDAHGVRHAKVEHADWGQRVNVVVETRAPAAVLTSIDAVARDEGLELSLGVRDIDPLATALARLFKATSGSPRG